MGPERQGSNEGAGESCCSLRAFYQSGLQRSPLRDGIADFRNKKSRNAENRRPRLWYSQDKPLD